MSLFISFVFNLGISDFFCVLNKKYLAATMHIFIYTHSTSLYLLLGTIFPGTNVDSHDKRHNLCAGILISSCRRKGENNADGWQQHPTRMFCNGTCAYIYEIIFQGRREGKSKPCKQGLFLDDAGLLKPKIKIGVTRQD